MLSTENGKKRFECMSKTSTGANSVGEKDEPRERAKFENYIWDKNICSGLYSAPVSRCGEHPQDDVPAVHPDDGAGGVQQVEVEVGVPGNGAVQTGLQERRPLFLQDPLRPALVPFAHTGHARHHHLQPGNANVRAEEAITYRHQLASNEVNTVTEP